MGIKTLLLTLIYITSLICQENSNQVGRYIFNFFNGKEFMIDTQTGQLWGLGIAPTSKTGKRYFLEEISYLTPCAKCPGIDSITLSPIPIYSKERNVPIISDELLKAMIEAANKNK